MVLHRSQGYASALLFGELLLASLVFWAWVVAWDTWSVQPFDSRHCLLLNEFLLVGMLLGVRSGKRRLGGTQDRAENTLGARRQAVGGLFAMLVVSVVSVGANTPRAFLISFAPVLYVALRTAKHYLPHWVALLLFDRTRPERVLIVGSPEEARRLAPWLRSKAAFGLKPVGLVHDLRESSPAAARAFDTSAAGWEQGGTEWRPRLPTRPSGNGRLAAFPVVALPEAGLDPVAAQDGEPGLPWLGPTNDLERVLASQPIDQVLVLGLGWPEGVLRDCVNLCEHRGVRLHVVSDLDEHFQHSVTLLEDGGVQLIGLREEPLESPLNRLAKRVMDIAIALPVVALVLPPAMIVVWLLHRWQSPGPVFFRQFRSGLRGRRFLMFKFRTMSVQNDDETRQVRRSDPRLFPAGAWMRRFSVDELPQFLNVLWGDMSAVGPRPHLPAHDEIFMQAMQNYRVRSAVKPGITGLAQVRGFRGGTQTDEDITRRVSSDIEYLERWTVELDVWILFRTLWQVVAPPKGAY